MAEILHLTALLPAAVSACCTIGAARTRGTVGVISAIVMLAAMLDLSGGGVLPPLAWSALLVAVAMGGALAARVGRALPGDAMAVHATSGLLVMAGLVLLMAHGPGRPGEQAGSGIHAAHGAGAGLLAGTVWAGAIAYLVFSGVLVRRRAAPRSASPGARAHPLLFGRWMRLEVAAMGASVALMAAALLA